MPSRLGDARAALVAALAPVLAAACRPVSAARGPGRRPQGLDR